MKTVQFCNDTKALNDRYRSALMQAARDLGYDVQTLGFFETERSAGLQILKYAIGLRCLCVTSNLRTNVISLLFPWRRGLLILNGMGRHRLNPKLRKLLLVLMSCNPRRQFAIQNHADFRFFRRFLSAKRAKAVHWVPGSGGTARAFGQERGPTAVQRGDKLPLVAPSLMEALATLHAPTLALVGCEPKDLDDTVLSGADGIICKGFVAQDDLLAFGDLFIQPRGYGEGFPHSLADALVSGMNAYVHHRDIAQYGLRSLGADVVERRGDWIMIAPTQRLKDALCVKEITNTYVRITRF